MHTPTTTISLALLTLTCGHAIAQHQHDGDDRLGMTKVHGCWGDAQGNLEGGIFWLPTDPDAKRVIDAVKQANRGVPDNRVDFVVVGDGYTAGEMDQFHADAGEIEDSFFRYEPFISYEPYFRFTKVEVVSNESGVDNDPNPGINRDTALDMAYWCGGTERLLCVSVSKAYMAAAAAPDIDQVIAISNSSKYGGAGYPSNDLGTAAGQNGSAVEIAIHEMGHSLGDLADEYTYGGPTTYNGPELTPVDVSIFNRQQQLDQNRKWWRWMDTSFAGFDGPVNTYEGGNYSEFGVYRPSNNSMMRSLGRPFNIVSAERLLHQIYKEVSPIDDGTPDGATVDGDALLWVTPMQPLSHDLSVLWYLDGQLIISAAGSDELDVATLGLASGEHTITVEVVDPTPWVRFEAIRDAFLTASRSFTVDVCSPAADFTGDGMVNFFDISAFLGAFNDGDPEADFNGDGDHNFFDISAFLQAFNQGGC
ncbi:MAG: M64 family metallopeptidase [Phycisphaerales bacterium]